MEQVVHLAMQETVPEPKMLGLLQDLCRSSTELLVAVVSKIAEAATTAGQELLRYRTQYFRVECMRSKSSIEKEKNHLVWN